MSGYAHFSPTFIRSGSVKVKPLRRDNINLNRAALIMVGNPSVLHHIDLDKRVVVVYGRLGAAPPPQLRKKPLCMPSIVMCFREMPTISSRDSDLMKKGSVPSRKTTCSDIFPARTAGSTQNPKLLCDVIRNSSLIRLSKC